MSTPMPPPPKKVVRFYGNADFALETVALNEITFIHSDKFNDPFDPNYTVKNEFSDHAELANWVKKHHPDFLDYFLKHFPASNNLNTVNEKVTKEIKKLFKNTYIFSTCKPMTKYPDRTYMWGHYGNGHRGVAIEFDLEKLQQLSWKGKRGDFLTQEMEYHDNSPKISCEEYFEFMMFKTKHPAFTERKIMEKLNKVFSWKHKDWELENEYRLMWRNDKTNLSFIRKPLMPATITSIYLGCRIDKKLAQKFEKEIRNKHPNANLYAARQNVDKLEFERIK